MCNISRNVLESKKTFINFLVILDCFNSAAHFLIPLEFVWWDFRYNVIVKLSGVHRYISRKIFQNETVCFAITGYNQFMSSMNRAIPVAIAIYRYFCVFHDSTIRDPRSKRSLQQSLLSFIFGIPIFSFITFARFPVAFQRFLECSGKEEVFKYDLHDFYNDKSIGPLTNFETFSISRWGNS